MDAIGVELCPFAEETRLVVRYEHPSLRLELAERPEASAEEMERAREVMGIALGRVLTADEEAQVLPGHHDLRPFGDAHDITYRSESRLIVEVDFLVPEEAWVVVEPFPEWPRVVDRGALVLSAETAAADGDDVSNIPVAVQTDDARSQVLIDLSYQEGVGDAYALSDECVAVVKDGRITAFFGRLASG